MFCARVAAINCEAVLLGKGARGNETRVAETYGEGKTTGDEEPSIVTALPGMHI